MKSTVLSVWIIIIITATVSGQFLDITNNSGVNHAHVHGQLLGGGIAVIDLNNDGFEDLVMTGGEGKDRLYINNRNGTFTDNSEVFPQNTNKTEVTSGVVAGDFNRDGCIDLFFTSFNKEENCILLENDCEGAFKDVSNRAGVVETSSSTSATLIDYDLDGDLDIYVINYIGTNRLLKDEDGNVSGFDHDCLPNFLYENEGNFRFRERAADLGIQGEGCGLAVTSFNFIENKPAIYIANDFGEWVHPNELFIYESAQDTFIEEGLEYGLDYGLYGMGIAIGDPDNDEDLDFYVTNVGQNAYLVNENGYYTERSVESAIDNTLAPDSSFSVSWGVVFFEADNDGYDDLFVANGWIPTAEFIKSSFFDPCKLFINEEGQYSDQSESYNIGFDYSNRGVVFTDFSNDGRQDLVLSGLDDVDDPDEERKFRLLENKDTSHNNYVSILLEGIDNNVEGFGAMVDLYNQGKLKRKVNYSGGPFCSQNSQRLHFGLGIVEGVDSLVVTWPNGNKDVLFDIPINQLLSIKEGGQIDILGCMDDDDPYFNSQATVNSGCLNESTTSTENSDVAMFNVYPRIVEEGVININVGERKGKVNIQVNNIKGVSVFDKILHPHNDGAIRINLPLGLSSGMYIVSLRSEKMESFTSRKIIVK